MTRGEVKTDGNECQQCAKGNGPWTTCVVLEGHFGGACANCQYPAQPNQCSLRREREREKREREVAQSREYFNVMIGIWSYTFGELRETNLLNS
jgi:hypothetical protein